ncbi:MAG: hypothetical protein OXF48_00910 [Bacteroidetes bacterium]|nr:hypothetical protein [Bacteroidota bacterium]
MKSSTVDVITMPWNLNRAKGVHPSSNHHCPMPILLRSLLALLVVFSVLLIASCDSSFTPDVDLSEDKFERVQKWYDATLQEEKEIPPILSIISNKMDSDSTITAVLAAMVRQHPPDWGKMEVWDNGAGGYFAATVLKGHSTPPL